MSLKGEINKASGDIRRAVSQIANGGVLGLDGMPRGTRKILGYVCAINTEGELAGTIDVQEFNYEPGEYSTMGVGHHRGVFLSAIQENNDGVLIVPLMYSEVVIVQNPADGHEYVLMYSHAQRCQVLARSIEGEDNGEVEIGVTEIEKFVETDDGLDKDYDELEPTKNQTNTKYTSTSITDKIISPDDEEGYTEEKTVEHKTISVGDTTITIDGQNVIIETSGAVSFTIGGTSIEQKDGEITINTDKAKIESSSCEIKSDNAKIDSTSCEIKSSTAKIDSSNCEIKGSKVTLTGGTLQTKGTSSPDLNGPYNAIKVCPFSGAPHCGSMVSGT